jgi:hypothetical protein
VSARARQEPEPVRLYVYGSESKVTGTHSRCLDQATPRRPDSRGGPAAVGLKVARATANGSKHTVSLRVASSNFTGTQWQCVAQAASEHGAGTGNFGHRSTIRAGFPT